MTPRRKYDRERYLRHAKWCSQRGLTVRGSPKRIKKTEDQKRELNLSKWNRIAERRGELGLTTRGTPRKYKLNSKSSRNTFAGNIRAAVANCDRKKREAEIMAARLNNSFHNRTPMQYAGGR